MKLTGRALTILVVICFAFFAFSCAEKEDTEALKKQIEQLTAEKADLEAKASAAAAQAGCPNSSEPLLPEVQHERCAEAVCRRDPRIAGKVRLARKCEGIGERHTARSGTLSQPSGLAR